MGVHAVIIGRFLRSCTIPSIVCLQEDQKSFVEPYPEGRYDVVVRDLPV